jgi:membrane-associated phospholipid phosphatase
MPRLPAVLANAFLVLTFLVPAGVTASIDRRAGWHVGPPAGDVWSHLTEVGDPAVTAGLFAVGVVVLRRRGMVAPAWAWAGALAVGLIVEVACKAWVAQTPTAPPERVLALVSLSYSYPSGHATRVVLLAGLAAAIMPRLSPVWFGYAAFLVVGVVLTGMHPASDAAGGVLLGGALAATVSSRWPARRDERQREILEQRELVGDDRGELRRAVDVLVGEARRNGRTEIGDEPQGAAGRGRRSRRTAGHGR